jgi:ubiquinone/menaquinone biosynthesis C-methylase UbiE
MELTPRETEQRFFDQFVADHGDFNPFADRGWRTLERRFCAMVAPPPGADLLDIGCGTGQSRQIYRSHVARYTGIDLSPAAIASAQARFAGDEWQVADACRLPFPAGRFDVVAFSSVLHHIPDFGSAIAEAFRLLKPGGRVFAFDPNVFHPAMALFRHPRSPLYLRQGVSPNERPLAPAALRRAFEQAGFVAVRQRCQSDIPYRRIAPRLLNTMLTAYNVADWLWQRAGLARWFGTFVLSCATKPAGKS